MQDNMSLMMLKQQPPQLEDRRSILNALKECTRTKDLKTGKFIHKVAAKNGAIEDIYVASALVNMYSKCGDLLEARNVFENINRPSVVPWTTLMLGYADNGDPETTLGLYEHMVHEGPSPNARTFLAIFKACALLASKETKTTLKKTMVFHSHAVQSGWDRDVFVTSSLVDTYSKCGSTVDARNVFERTRFKDVVCWNVMIMGYAENGEGALALEVFHRMKLEGCAPNDLSFVAALKSCTCLACNKEGQYLEEVLRRNHHTVSKRPKIEALQEGMSVHFQAANGGFDSDIRVANTLISMYANCGSMEDAHAAFDHIKHPTVVSWTCLILGYADNKMGNAGLELFYEMKRQGYAQDSICFIAALKACTALTINEECEDEAHGTRMKALALEKGFEVHSLVSDHGCSSDIYVASTMVDMYAKCGSMDYARRVFDGIQYPNVVAWNALLLGYVDNGKSGLALELFSQMKARGCTPDAITYMVALRACGAIGALKTGGALHGEICSAGFQNDPLLTICLVDFYGKCGSMPDAQRVFDSAKKNHVIWTALMVGYSSNGKFDRVFELFAAMKDAGFRPNDVTFSCILNVCSHAGLLDKGKEYFNSMSSKYGVSPDLVHYNCMIDILGRANELNGVKSLLDKMPFLPNVVTWRTVLGACRKWKNAELGKMAFHSLLKLDENSAGNYLSMADMF